MTPGRTAKFLRLIEFASAAPRFAEDDRLPTHELATFTTNGIAGRPAGEKNARAS